jgi:ABC-2 type transport system permease protein
MSAIAARPVKRAWPIVAEQELRDLWLAGRGLPLIFGYSLLLSAITYLGATNTALNFLEQRESVNLTLQVAVAAGSLLVLLGAADAISGERERSTLESLLLSPASRLSLVVGKGLAALSIWVAAFSVAVPYVWFLGRGLGVVGVALGNGFLVGLLLALFLAGLGLLLSALSSSNRFSLSVSLFVLLALFAPTQLPGGAQQSWIGDLLQRIDPISSGLHYLGKVIVDGHSTSQELSWLIGPAVAAGLAVAAALASSRSLNLRGGPS